MALRRPPTRIELKSDDIEEYDQVSPQSDECVSFVSSHNRRTHLTRFVSLCVVVIRSEVNRHLETQRPEIPNPT